MLDLYHTLEVEKILNDVATYSKSAKNKQNFVSLRMFTSFDALKNELDYLAETIKCIERYSSFPLSVVFEMEKYIELADKGGALEPIDLSHISEEIESTLKLRDYFKKISDSTYPLLTNLVSDFYNVEYLKDEINRVILPNLEISSKASKELEIIRLKIKGLELKVRDEVLKLVNKYSSYLTETTFSIRDDHYVLPVKNADKNKINGIIHDVSSSGQTVFVEPASLVQISNDIYYEKKEEKEEIHRILLELTKKVLTNKDELINNNKILERLDFLSSKAIYAIENKCCVANLINERKIELFDAKHPLIDKNKVVSNTFIFNKDKRIIIITGPNAGGKTVALKTLGINVLLNQLGLAVFANEQSSLCFFPKIYADIGDNQSLADNLSTFSAHISNISTIVHYAKSEDLVLIDELGTGTSPFEGESLAVAVSDHLLKTGCFAFISSHFDKMKQYAFTTDLIENAMMELDEKSYTPTYKLIMGRPGKSYGLEMAKRYRLDEEVIKNAKRNMKSNKSDSIFATTFEKLNKTIAENEKLKNDLDKKRHDLIEENKRLSKLRENYEKEKKSLKYEIEKERQKIISDTNEQVSKAIKLLSKQDVKAHELIKLKQELSMAISDEDIETLNNDLIFNIGDLVSIKELGFEGTISSINGNKVSINCDGSSIKTTIDKLEHIEKPEFRMKKVYRNVDEMISRVAKVSTEINVIGERAEDGVRLVSKFLDDARLANLKQVRIVHGMGTGKLREAIWKYLKQCNFIDSYKYGESYEGGPGATIVVLK